MPALVAGLGTWLVGWEGVDKGFWSGRYVRANWDVGELVGRRDEIVERGLLRMNLMGRLGRRQFR